ncbi:MAG: PAS domain S-box protein [Desulfococcaceae bacterium]
MDSQSPEYGNREEELIRLRERVRELETGNQERSQAMEELRKREQRLRTALDNVKSAIVLLDVQGRIICCNRHCQEISGFTREEITGKSHLDFTIAEDIPQALERMQKIIHGKIRDYTTERRWRKKDGTGIWTEMSVSAVPDANGEIQYLTASVTDISDRKRFEAALMENERHLLESEQYLSTVLETLRAGVLIVDYLSHRINDVNRYAAKLIGSEKEKIIGRPCYSFFSGAGTGKCPVTDMGRTLENFEQSLIAEDGRHIPILKSVTTSLRNGRKQLIECFTDISFLKKLMKEQEMDTGLAKKILVAINGCIPRYTDLPGGLSLFAGVISLSCHQEGGDHYFIRTLPPDEGHPQGRTLISLKDQSGHQVGCILRSIFTDLIYQSVMHCRASAQIEQIVSHVNRMLGQSDFFSKEDFLTSVNCEIDHASLMMRYVSCGHPRFFVIRNGHRTMLPEGKGRAGANPPMIVLSDYSYSAGEFQMEPGDRLILYTDGLLDATVPAETQQKGGESLSVSDLESMAGRLLSGRPNMPVEDIMMQLIKEIARISGTEIDPRGKNFSHDDITLLGIEIEKQKDFAEEIWYLRDAGDFQQKTSDFIHKRMQEWESLGFSKPFRLQICFEEAMINAWMHGNHCDPYSPISVRYRYGNDFHIEITDAGQGFDIRNAPDPRKKINLLRESGRGLFIIRHYTSRARWNDKGSQLMMVFKKYPNSTEEKYIRMANGNLYNDQCL